MNTIVQQSENRGLDMNISETKLIEFSKRHVNITLKIKGKNAFPIQIVTIIEQNNPKVELKLRIKQ